MSEKILEVLGKLDPSNDNQWTTEGQPKLEIIRLLSGDPKVSRDQLTALAPTLTRESLRKELADKAAQDAVGSAALAVVQATAEPAVATAPPGPPLQAAPEATRATELLKSDDDEPSLAEEQHRLAHLLDMREQVNAEIVKQQAKVDSMLENEEVSSEPAHLQNQRCIQQALQASLKRNETRAALIAEHGQTRLVRTAPPSPLDQSLAKKR